MAYNYITPEERRKAEREARALSSPRYGLEEYAQKPVQSMTEPQQERAGVGERALHTVGDLFGNVISGAAKGLEGIYDLGASAVGAVGGVFDKGFQERVKQHVAYDFTGEHVAKPLDRMTEHSYLNEGKVGSFIENVASGVGQMLPAVAVSLATAGIGGAVGLAPSAVTKAAQAASLGTLTASAAGSGTEEAFSDGADYGKGMAYGMATGVVEGLTEKIWGGFGGLTGKGVLDGLGKGVAKTGLARVAKEAVQEGTEEAIASVASPSLKSIYKGRDAFSEYGEGDFWRGVGESALVGAGTSVAYGGTVGYLNKTSGKRADVREVLDEIGELERARAALFAEGELTPGSDADVKTARGIDANYRLLERVLKRAKPAVREDIIKGNGLSDRFNDDGSLRAKFLSASRDLPSGEQTEGQKENAPVGQNFASQARYMSPSLWRARGRVDADLASLTEQRRGVPGQENAAALRLFEGELSENGAAAYGDAKRAWNALSTKTGGTMQLAVIDGDERVRGARRGSTVYISKNALEDGRWADTLLEEATHFSQGSREHFALGKFLAGQTDIMDEVRAELSEEGNPYGFTEEDTKALREGRSREFGNEMVAHAAAKILDTPRYVERLVRADRTLAEKIRNRVEDVKAALESLGSRASRRAYNRLQRTAQLFENALEGGGQIVAGRIEKGEKESLTGMNSKNMQVSEDGEFSFVGTTKDGKRVYKSGFDENVSEEERVSQFKKRVRAIFELGAVELKTDTKKIKVSADRFTAKKNLHGDEASQPDEMSAKISALYDLVDILETARYVSKSVEESYADPQQPPKNAAHKNVKYWYKFKNEIVFDGVPYTVTFNIRDKGKEQYAYLIDFHKKSETSDHNDTAQKSFAPAGQTSHTPIIAKKSEKSTPDGDFSLENVPEEANQQTSGDLEGKISSGMTDVQRYNILKNRVIEGIPTVNASPENAIIQSWGEVNALLGKEKRAFIRGIANKLHVFGKSYTNADIDISFEFSRNNFEESYSKQMHNYEEFAKMFSVFSSVIEQGICIEVHKREDYNPDPTLKNVHVMASAFRDGEYVVPVKLEVKEFTDKPSKLYVAIALEKIKMTEVSEQGNTKNGVTQDSRSVTISIADLLRNVNPSDVNFYKYIPKEFFSEEDTELKSPEFQGTEKTISELNEDEIEEVISLIRKTPYKLSKAQKTRAAEHYGSFEVVRKQLFGRTSLRKTTAKRVPMLAEQWKEWSRVLPKIFDKTVPNRDKGVVLADIVNQLYSARESTGAAKIKKKYREAYARQKEHMREELAQEKAAFDSKIEEAEARYKENDFRIKISQEIQKIVKEIHERKEGYFRAGSTRRSAEVLEFVDKLSQINYSRMLTGSVRNIFRGFRDWFTPQNEALSEWFENEEHAETGRDIMDMLAALSEGEGDENTPLTLDEMRMVRNVVSFFDHLEDGWHKVRRGDQFVDALPIANEYQKKMFRARQNRSFIVSGLLNRIWGSDKKKRGAIARYVMEFGDPMMIARLFDSYDKQGFWTETMEEWREAGIRMDVQRMDMLRSYKEFFEGRKGIEKRLAKEKITYRGREMSLDIAASLYMTMKRKQAQRGLVESYYTFFAENGDKLGTNGFSPRATYEQGKLEDAEIAKICYEQRTALWEMFDEETRDYISMLEKIYEETRQVRRDAELKNKGFSYIEEEGGYYYPIKRDQVAQSIARIGAHGDRVGHQSTDRHVVKGANAGLVILPASAVLLDHVNQTVLEANFHAARENFNVLVNLDIGENAKNAKTIKRAAETRDDTSEMYKYMQQLARDIQGINDTRRSAFDELFRVIRSNYAIFQLGANPKTIAVQTSAMIAATDVLDVSSVLQTAHKGFIPASAAEVDKYCRLAELRNSENSAALAQGVLERTGRLGSVLMKGIGWMDRRMICSLFEACRVQVEKDSKGKYKVGSEENGIRAGELLQRVILETQQNSLVTERSAMMRNKGNILNLFTMFSADAMKLCGRLVDAMGEYSVIYKKYRAANAADAKALKGQLDAAGKQLCKSVSVSVVSAIFTALIAQAFRWLYAKDDDKEPGEIAKQMAVDALGNTMGGLPIVRDIYSALMQGYDMDIFMLTTANDLLDAVSGTFSIAGDIFSGKEVTEQEIARNIRGTLYAGGAVLGIPVRNLYNTGAGLVSRVNRQAKYAIDGFFYEHNYTADLAAAIEAEDDKMVETIADLITDGSVGSLDKQTREVLRRLVGAGYDVLPRTLGDSITYEGEKIALTRAQKKRFRTVYDVADEAVADLVRRKSFKETDEKTQAKAIKFIYNTYYGLACDDVLGVDSTKKSVLFAEAIEVDKLALIATQARSLEADFGPDGKAISGSRRKKVERFVESLALTAAQKYMIMGYLGYKNKNGRAKVQSYIATLGLSESEAVQLLEWAGYH